MSSKLFPILELFDNTRTVWFWIHLQGNAETTIVDWVNVISTSVTQSFFNVNIWLKIKGEPTYVYGPFTADKATWEHCYVITLMQLWWFHVNLSMAFCWKHQLSQRIFIDETNVDKTILKQLWQYLLLWFCTLDSSSIANLNYVFKSNAYMFLFWRKKIGIELESNYSVKELDRIYIKQKVVIVKNTYFVWIVCTGPWKPGAAVPQIFAKLYLLRIEKKIISWNLIICRLFIYVAGN